MTGRRSEQRTPRYLFEAPRLEILEVVPELAEVQSYVFDSDPNPRGLAIYHTPGTDLPGHACAPRVDATCMPCGRVYHLCLSWSDEIVALCKVELDAIRDECWRCNDCREVANA